MSNLTLYQREQHGEQLWENYLINSLTHFKHIHCPTFLANFWANYEQLIVGPKVNLKLAADNVLTDQDTSINPNTFTEIFNRYWAKPISIHQYSSQQIKRKLSKALVYALLSLLVAPFALIYLTKALGRLVVVAGIVLIFYPREDAKMKEQKNKIATYKFTPQSLNYQSFGDEKVGDVTIAYTEIYNLWHHAEGRVIAGKNAQMQWPDNKGNHLYQVIIPNHHAGEWPNVRSFLSEIAQQNLQLDT